MAQTAYTLDYAPLSAFTDKSCTISLLEPPKPPAGRIVAVRQTHVNTPQNYYTSSPDKIVKAVVTYVPYDNSDGKALLAEVQKVVNAPLKKDYKAAPATINQFRNGKMEAAPITINDCIVTEGAILVDSAKSVRITFKLEGINAGA